MIYSAIYILLVTCAGYLRCEQSDFKDYVIVSDSLPDDVRFRPPIGNGHVATNVFSDTVYMNGLYNGRNDRSSRARIPSYVNVDVNLTQEFIMNTKYTLDMYNGLFKKQVQTRDMNVTITTFAHRQYPELIVTQLHVDALDTNSGNITLQLINNLGEESTAFTWTSQDVEVNKQRNIYKTGTIRETELADEKPKTLHVYYSVIPDTVELPGGPKSFSISYMASHSTNKSDALRVYEQSLHHSYTNLLDVHSQVWRSLWDEGRIDIYGNKELSTNLAAATYNILCSLPTKANTGTPFYGIGPGGLSRGGLLYPDKPGGPKNDYAGHVFWDMDTWVMPPIMMFHPGMARQMIGARTRVLDQAKVNAMKSGNKGARFPWEQASTGVETTPLWAGNMSQYEIHVTADIAYGLRQYLYATDDVSILNEGRGLEMATEIARFWQSRITIGANNTVEILGVMGPDEYHSNVNNSVFTNYNAKLSLILPSFLIDNFKLSVNQTMREEYAMFVSTADRIVIPFDATLKFHPQYQDFNLSVPIKQSDVVLLGYPLMLPMSNEVRRNDLQLYEKITDMNGPDTGTWSMHTVGWLELGEERRAHTNFLKMFRNINEPFKVFSEKPVTNTSNGGCVNFITGAGGLLQSVLFGYGGLRLHPDKLEINPKPLFNTTSWRLKGIHYKGTVIDIRLENHNVLLTVSNTLPNLRASIDVADSEQTELQPGKTFTFKQQVAYLHINHLKNNNTVTQVPPNTEHTTSDRSRSTSSSHNNSFLMTFTLSLILLLANI